MTPVHLADQLDGIFMTGEKDEEELLGIKFDALFPFTSALHRIRDSFQYTASSKICWVLHDLPAWASAAWRLLGQMFPSTF